MARTACNPIVLSDRDNNGLAIVPRRATDAQTWKIGEVLRLNSGAVCPLSGATGGTAMYGLAAEAQATATASSDVKVMVLKTGTRLLAYGTTNGSNAAASAFTVGTKYAGYMASNITYVDSNVTSGGQFKIVEKLDASDTTDSMPERTAYDGQTTAGTPCLLLVEFVEA